MFEDIAGEDMSEMKTNSRTVSLVGLFLGLITIFSLSGCTDKHHAEEHGTYAVAAPWRQDLTINKEYVAQIRASQHIELRAFEKGYLTEIFVDEGQMIEEGQKMFQIMPLIMKAEYAKAKAEYDVAKIEYKNTKRLANKNVVSANELALAKARLDKAKAEKDLAQTHLDLTLVKAPFTGFMGRFEVRLGSLVEEGELLTTLSDNRNMWVYFNVSESDYLDYMETKKKTGDDEVQLMLPNGKYFENKGKIDTIEADFNNETGNVAFRASFANPEGLLRHGETGTVILSEPLKSALVVPQKATFEVLDKKFVYVVDADHKVQTRQIEVSHEVSHLFVVSSGLEESDTILLEGLGKINIGQEIETKKKSREEVIASLNLKVE